MKAQKAPSLPQTAYEIPPLPYVHKLPELPDSDRESFQIIRVLVELVPHKVKIGELEEARALYRKYKPTFPDSLQRFIDNRLKEAAVYAQIVGATT
jgi:hypothetical protein